jgi:hypothetical protein
MDNKVRQGMTKNQMKSLVSLLNNSGFVVRSSGHVDVAKPLANHPISNANAGMNPPVYLPVGFVVENCAFVVNTDEKFPEDYHAKLKQIYASV